MAERFDVSTTKKWKLDARGRLIVEATPTRSGIFKYIYPDGSTVRELRHPDDVFSQDTMDSLEVIPYTIQENHTSLMTPEDVRGKTYGTTMSGAKRVDNLAKINIKINDGKEIKDVMKGESLELSNAYTCDVIKESGTFDSEEYDVRQKNIIYDHVARVKKARGGENCRIRLDSADSAICGIDAERLDSGETQKHSKGETMSEKTKVIQRELPMRESGKFRLDAQEIEVDEAQKGIIDTFLGRENKLFTALKESETAGIERKVNLDAAESRIKELEKNLENAVPSGDVEARLDSRLQLWDLASFYGLKDFKTKPEAELEIEVIKTSGRFDEADIENPEYRKFCIKNLSTDTSKKIHKSRANLENSSAFKTDAADGKSALERA